MANHLATPKKDEVRELYLKTKSIRLVAKALGIGRNTVRRFLRDEGIADRSVGAKPVKSQHQLSEPSLQKLDFLLLQKMFAKSGEPSSASDFEMHIKDLAKSIADELGVNGRIDTIRIEGAVANYISWRRFYFMSLEASDKEYCGPFKKYHEKVAIAVDRWVSASNKAFDQMNRLIRELEIKYGRRGPDLGRNNIFVQNQQVNVEAEGPFLRRKVD